MLSLLLPEQLGYGLYVGFVLDGQRLLSGHAQLALIFALGALPFAAAAIRRYIHRRRMIARLMAWPVAGEHGVVSKTAALANPSAAPLHAGPTTQATGSITTHPTGPRMQRAA